MLNSTIFQKNYEKDIANGDQKGWLPSCVKFGMLILYLTDLKNSSKLNMRRQKQAQKQVDFKDI